MLFLRYQDKCNSNSFLFLKKHKNYLKLNRYHMTHNLILYLYNLQTISTFGSTAAFKINRDLRVRLYETTRLVWTFDTSFSSFISAHLSNNRRIQTTFKIKLKPRPQLIKSKIIFRPKNITIIIQTMFLSSTFSPFLMLIYFFFIEQINQMLLAFSAFQNNDENNEVGGDFS